MPELASIVLGSSNPGKLAELCLLLEGLPFRVLGIQEVLGHSLLVREDGATFEDNAILKARAVAHATGMPSLADDSGLEVDALGGRPGVRSARFAHERATDAENNRALLKALDRVSDRERSARFRCVLAVATPGRDFVTTAAGTCEGSIARVCRGDAGFGYDPLFLVNDMGGRVMAELSPAEKNGVSHRGRALRALRPILLDILESSVNQPQMRS